MCVWDKVIKPNRIRQERRQITELNSQNGGGRIANIRGFDGLERRAVIKHNSGENSHPSCPVL